MNNNSKPRKDPKPKSKVEEASRESFPASDAPAHWASGPTRDRSPKERKAEAQREQDQEEDAKE